MAPKNLACKRSIPERNSRVLCPIWCKGVSLKIGKEIAAYSEKLKGWSDDLRTLWRDRYQHMHMILHQVAFFYPALLVLRQLLEYLPKMRPEFFVQRLSSALGNEYHMLFARPSAMA
jgi:hypothetical protein